MQIKLSQVRKIIITLIFVLISGWTGFFLGRNQLKISQNGVIFKNSSADITNNQTPSGKQDLDFGLFWKVWDKVESDFLYRKDIDRKNMLYGAIYGMVASLGDPYTVFLPPKENKETKEDLRGDFEGVGIQIGYNKDQKLTVIAPLLGTPAEQSGIKAGDVILKIVDEKNGINKDTNGISLPEAVNLIRGKKGTTVALTIQREKGKDPLVFNLKRDTIVVKSVDVKFERKNGKQVAILTLSRFGEKTSVEWVEAVNKIKGEEGNVSNFSGVVLDLRNNPGGYLEGAVFIGSEFASSGLVVRQDRGDDGKEDYIVNRQGKLLKEPLVVLINGGSASAAEIVAGFLQETKRAKVVGEKSFGKGSIQEAEDVEGGAGLHITIARWLLPSGKSVDKEGVSPDIEIKSDLGEKAATESAAETEDLQLQKAIEILTK